MASEKPQPASGRPWPASEEPRGGDGRTDSPLYSTGLRPLRFPPGPLPCLHNSHHQKIIKQGKGTDDHLLPLGDWSTLVQRVSLRVVPISWFPRHPPFPGKFPSVPVRAALGRWSAQLEGRANGVFPAAAPSSEFEACRSSGPPLQRRKRSRS